MRFEPVTGRVFWIDCCRCGARLPAGDYFASGEAMVYADLDGEAFVAYYCRGCKKILERKSQ